MKKKLSCVLLVDDDNDSNYFLERLLLKLACTEKIHIASNGKNALDFLTSTDNGEYANPDIIFLDINMPQMDGWEFLKEYEKLAVAQRAKIVLIMLTTSLNPDDEERGLRNRDVKGFCNKYLDIETLRKILMDNFPNHF